MDAQSVKWIRSGTRGRGGQFGEMLSGTKVSPYDHFYCFALSRSRFAPVCGASVATRLLIHAEANPPVGGEELAVPNDYNSLIPGAAVRAMKFRKTALMIGFAAFHRVALGRRNTNVAMSTPDRSRRIICLRSVSKILHDGNGTSYNGISPQTRVQSGS
jgi:hypothetical protein